MSTIMTRSGAEFWWGKRLGKTIPKEAHSFVMDHGGGLGAKPNWRMITWADIFATRTAINKSNEENNRLPDTIIKPCIFWCFYNNTTFFGGWWSGIWTIGHYYDVVGKYIYRKDLIIQAMEIAQLGILPIIEFEYDFYKKLSMVYPSNGFHKKPKRWPQGLFYCYCTIEGGKVTGISKERPIISVKSAAQI